MVATASKSLSAAPQVAGVIHNIPTTRIERDPTQPRKEFSPEYINHLGDQIVAEGLKQPILVRKNPNKPGYFMIVAGECRWRAHRLKGIQVVPSRITMLEEDTAKRFRTQVLENKGRRDMSLKEDAFACKQMTENGDDDKAIATIMCMSVPHMQNVRRMTVLREQTWSLIMGGSINAEVAKFAMGHVSETQIDDLLIRTKDKGRSQAAAIVDNFIDQMKQDSFELACVTAGVTQHKATLVKLLATQLMQVAGAIDKLSSADQAKLARQIGVDVAGMVPKTKAIRRSAVFVTKVMARVNAEIGS